MKSDYLALGGLEFTMCTKLALNSHRSAYFDLQSAMIKGVGQHTQLEIDI